MCAAAAIYLSPLITLVACCFIGGAEGVFFKKVISGSDASAYDKFTGRSVQAGPTTQVECAASAAAHPQAIDRLFATPMIRPRLPCIRLLMPCTC